MILDNAKTEQRHLHVLRADPAKQLDRLYKAEYFLQGGLNLTSSHGGVVVMSLPRAIASSISIPKLSNAPWPEPGPGPTRGELSGDFMGHDEAEKICPEKDLPTTSIS
jgi:hypothetical protein